MPCMHYEDPWPDNSNFYKPELDKVTALLCKQCKELITRGQRNLLTDDVAAWYKRHEEQDVKRRTSILKQIAELDKQKESLQKQLED